MPLVIDANITGAWFRHDVSKLADAALDALRAAGAIVPPLWRWEVSGRFGDEFSVARKYGLTVYDSLLRQLALRRAIPFATIDTKLASADATVGAAFLFVSAEQHTL